MRFALFVHSSQQREERTKKRRPIKAGILLMLLLVFSTPPSLRTPPLYFALQNTGEEGEMYFSFASAPIL